MNILVTLKENHFLEVFDDETKTKIETLGNVVYRPELNQNTSEEDYLAALKHSYAEIVITCWGSPKLTYSVYKKNHQLKYLCHVAGEVRPYVDLDCIKDGLIVSNWGNVIAKSVAEGTLLMILAALRRITYFQMEMHIRKGWAGKKRPEGLFYQRVGLLGLGAIARELVKLLQLFACKVYAYDPYIADNVFESLNVIRLASIEKLFETCRIVSIHAPNIPDNYHIVNRQIISKLEHGGIIINTARGSLIDTDALIAELKTGRIHAAMDVFEHEPLSENSELRGLENCLLMPHQAGPTPDRWIDMGNLAVGNIENFVKGREVVNVITPEKYNFIT
jgi:phosphoglycerate dehydrogenase-like enzyme